MSFEETLAVLHGWLGKDLEVAIRTRDGTMVADLRGRLELGSELSRAAEEGPIYFQLEGVGGSGFFLAKGDFRGAEWRDADQRLLAIRIGSVELLIDSTAETA